MTAFRLAMIAYTIFVFLSHYSTHKIPILAKHEASDRADGLIKTCPGACEPCSILQALFALHTLTRRPRVTQCSFSFYITRKFFRQPIKISSPAVPCRSFYFVRRTPRAELHFCRRSRAFVSPRPPAWRAVTGIIGGSLSFWRTQARALFVTKTFIMPQ